MIMECLRSPVTIYVIKEEAIWTNATNYVNVSSGPRFTKIRKSYEFVRPIV